MLLSLRQASGPLYRRVYLALKVKIRAGGLGPATKVPSTRALAGTSACRATPCCWPTSSSRRRATW
jgi:DNA-binding transcriptional regulator YhcF (GntR family)